MTKTYKGIRLTDETLQQLDDIRGKFGLGSRTAAIEYAVSVLWQKECQVSKEHLETLARIAELEKKLGLKPGENPPAPAPAGKE